MAIIHHLVCRKLADVFDYSEPGTRAHVAVIYSRNIERAVALGRHLS